MPRFKKTGKSGSVPNKKTRVNEIVKCGKDASYFIKKYVKISHPKKGLIPFKTFGYQDNCLSAFQENRYVIVNKSRQLGLSTISAAYSLWMALFQKEKNVLVIATKLEVAKTFIRKVDGMLSSLPKWLVMPDVIGRSVKQLQFSNGSQIKAIPTSPDAGRSEALSLLIVDEAAHIDDIDDLWLGLQPTLSTGGSAILISTPNGVGNLFHKLFSEAQNGQNNFLPIEIPWFEHPEHDEAWFEDQKKQIIAAKGERGVAQELLCSFNASGETFIKTELMSELEKEIEEPLAHHDLSHDVWMWKYPEPSFKYILSADIARGDAEDYSTFHIINSETDEICCEFKGKISPDKFADLIFELGTEYNNALVCPELNSFGMVTANKLKIKGYPNLFYEKYSKNFYMAANAEIPEDEMPGFTVTSKNRNEILANLENVLRNKKLKFRSKRLFEELKTFIWKGSKAQAQKGYNDDLIMALAIGANLYEAAGSYAGGSADLAQAMLAGMSKSTRMMDKNTNKISQNEIRNPSQAQPAPFYTSRQLKSPRGQGPGMNPKKNTQDMNNPFWSQWGWVTKD